MARPENGKKGRKHLNTIADQVIAPAASCAKIGDFFRFMGDFLKDLGTHTADLAKKFPFLLGDREIIRLTDGELLKRLGAICSEVEVKVAGVAKELLEARQRVRDGLVDERMVARIHKRYNYRMHDLGEFMKTQL